jgi:mono/diheme cytochrome c family protein
MGGCEAAERADKSEHDAAAPDAPPAHAYADWGDPFAELPKGPEHRARVCESDQKDDVVHRVFCAENPPEITSLRDLQGAFGLDPDQLGGFSGSALTGHSTSLSRRAVSAINPRAILFRLVVNLLDEAAGTVEFVTLAFSRGEQFAEIAIDHDKEFRFYVVRFQQECNERPEGCTPGELLTEGIERDWRDVTLYDEKSLANTVLDCATCHQPDGPDSPKILRMQEFDDPWTHWFFNSTPGGRALVDDYTAAKGDESLAGLPREDIGGISPGGLETLVGGRNHYQPNPFESELIEKEVVESAAADGGNQPLDNRVRGSSPTWQAAYERSKRGEFIPVPYHNVKVTDPDKLARMTEAYQAYRNGDLDVRALPDLRDVLPDDHAQLAEMGISTEPGLSGEEVLIQACSQCHNERLDQGLSRARFRADLQGVSRAEKEVAIGRLMLPPSNVHAMPPARLRVLSPEAKARAIEALRR